MMTVRLFKTFGIGLVLLAVTLSGSSGNSWNGTAAANRPHSMDGGFHVSSQHVSAFLTLAPSSVTIGLDGWGHLSALYDPDGPSGPKEIQDVSWGAQWSSDPRDRVTVNVSGVLYGRAAGRAAISASYRGLTATAQVRVSGTVSQHSLQTPDGRTRSYLLYVPENIKHPAPLVIALHGGGGQGQGQEILSNMDTVAAENGFIVAYPDGIDRHWNDGRGIRAYTSHRENIDDVGFLSLLIDTISGQFAIDPKRVYVMGMSNGSHMAKRLACELSHKITAVGTVGSTIPRAITPSCSFSHPMPLVHFHGTKDRLARWEGGDIVGGDTLSVPELMKFWSARNGCPDTPPSVSYEPDVSNDGTRVRRETYPCPQDGEVILYAIEEGGHTWPGGYQYWPESRPFPGLGVSIGKTSRDISASLIIWGFFQEHELQTGYVTRRLTVDGRERS